VSSEDVASKGIANDKYRVVILPFAFALSDEEVDRLADFVQRGGVVIADAAPGWMDQHCAWRTNDKVTKLFGILSPLPDKLEIKRAGDSAPIVKRTGVGWTVYLNTTWDQYPKLRAANFGGEWYRQTASAMFEKAGIKPAIQVTSPDGKALSQAQIARYQFGDAEIVAIVKDNVGVAGVVGQDGVTTYTDANLGQVAKQELTIRLPRKFYVADVRTGKQLGFTDVVHSSILVGDALVLGLSPQVNELKFEGPASVSPGEHVSFALTSNMIGTSLVRCHVYAPDGSRLSIYSNNVLVQGGRGTFSLPFALNDPSGKYLIRATDVVTGAVVESTIELGPGKP